MLKTNKSKIDGNGNNVEQVENQYNIYNVFPTSNYVPDEYACKLLKETIEDEQNPRIIFVKTFGGHSIQCGSCRFSVSSVSQTEREMSYWEDALNKLEKYDYISDVGYKGEVFKITKKGYDYYDSNIKNS